jgi:hypothetical protein
LPGYKEVYTEQDEALPGLDPISFDDTMESGLYDNDELGFFGDIISTIGDITGVSEAGKTLFRSLGILPEERAAPAPAAPAPTAPGMDMSALTGLMAGLAGQQAKPGLSAQEVQYIVKDMLSSISPPVRQKVREVINEMKGTDASEENLVSNIQQRVGSNVMPQLNKAIQALKLAQTQTEATSEHRALVRDQDRWRENMNNQQQLMNRIALMEKRIAKAMKSKRR